MRVDEGGAIIRNHNQANVNISAMVQSNDNTLTAGLLGAGTGAYKLAEVAQVVVDQQAPIECGAILAVWDPVLMAILGGEL